METRGDVVVDREAAAGDEVKDQQQGTLESVVVEGDKGGVNRKWLVSSEAFQTEVYLKETQSNVVLMEEVNQVKTRKMRDKRYWRE